MSDKKPVTTQQEREELIKVIFDRKPTKEGEASAVEEGGYEVEYIPSVFDGFSQINHEESQEAVDQLTEITKALKVSDATTSSPDATPEA